MGFTSNNQPTGSPVHNENGDLVYHYGTNEINLWAETNVADVDENTLYSRRVFNLTVENAEEIMLSDKITLIAYKAVQPNTANGYIGVYRADAFSTFEHHLETRYLSGSQGSTLDFKIGAEFAGLNLDEQGYQVTGYNMYDAAGCTPIMPTELTWTDFVATYQVVFDSKYVGTPSGSEKDYAHFTFDWSIGRPFNSPAQYKDAIEKTYAGNIEADFEHKLKTEQRMIIPYILHTPITIGKSKLKVVDVSGDAPTDVTSNYEFTFTTSSGFYYDADGYVKTGGHGSTIEQGSDGAIVIPGNIMTGTFYANRTEVAKVDGVNTCDSWVHITEDWENNKTTYSIIDYLVTAGEGTNKKGIGFLVGDYFSGTFSGVGPYSGSSSATVGSASYTVPFGTEFASAEKPENARVSLYAYGINNCTTGEAAFTGEGLAASVDVTPTDASAVLEAEMGYHLVFTNDVPADYSNWFSSATLTAEGKFEYQQNVDYSFTTVTAQA